MARMKKLLLFGMAAAVIIALSACGTAGDEASREATAGIEAGTTGQAAVEDWYKAVLDDKAVRAEYSYYSLQDINLDGVDELFLSSTEESFIGFDDKACLMANIGGKAETLQEIGGAGGEYWIVNPSDATLSYYSRLSGEEHITLYRLEDAGLTEVSSADIYSPHHYIEEDNEETVYLLDNEKVSEKEAESYWEQYGSKDGAVTYEAIQ